MVDQPVVALVGSSLLMDGVAIGLANSQLQRLARIECECRRSCERLITLKPDLIIFEVDHPPADIISSLIKTKSDLLLIGIDMEGCGTIVMNCCQTITHTMADLCKLVKDEVRRALPTCKGDPDLLIEMK